MFPDRCRSPVRVTVAQVRGRNPPPGTCIGNADGAQYRHPDWLLAQDSSRV